MLDSKTIELHDLKRQFELIKRKRSAWRKEQMVILNRIVQLESLLGVKK